MSPLHPSRGAKYRSMTLRCKVQQEALALRSDQTFKLDLVFALAGDFKTADVTKFWADGKQ